MTSQQRLDRVDGVYAVLGHLPGAKFGQHPACADEADSNKFFPVSGNGTAAKRVCARCPVQPECLEWALVNGPDGVWGGTTETERRRLRQDRGVEGIVAALRAEGWRW